MTSCVFCALLHRYWMILGKRMNPKTSKNRNQHVVSYRVWRKSELVDIEWILLRDIYHRSKFVSRSTVNLQGFTQISQNHPKIIQKQPSKIIQKRPSKTIQNHPKIPTKINRWGTPVATPPPRRPVPRKLTPSHRPVVKRVPLAQRRAANIAAGPNKSVGQGPRELEDVGSKVGPIDGWWMDVDELSDTICYDMFTYIAYKCLSCI